MLPVYDPKSFNDIDLRKYHIRDIKDVIKFQDFVVSRMEEARFVLQKFNTQFSTFKTVSKQLQNKQQEQQQLYGAPAQNPVTDSTLQIQKVDTSAEQEKKELLDEVRQAIANEEVKVEEGEGMDPSTATYGKYRVIDGKVRPMYYRDAGDGKGYRMISAKDVPEDIKEHLDELIQSVGSKKTVQDVIDEEA